MIGIFLIFILTGCSSIKQEEESIPVSEIVSARTVNIVNGKGEKIGKAVLTEEKSGVRLHMQVSGLKPGSHGFHIHEKEFMGTDFQTAGSHFNPTGKEHGHLNPKGSHMGDMKNLMVKANGEAKQTEFLKGATLSKGDAQSLLGRSIIIHEGTDDYSTDPTGNSGDRIAGGVIPK
ncbi:superoxide dismutase family protein [Ammoniphilus sp. CFH 90114]|nr:superoxide dismutase family protein [Ammoniphilus sp. CFH 90114]